MVLRTLHPLKWALAVSSGALVACGGGAEERIVARIGDESITAREAALYMQGAGYEPNLENVERAVDEMVDMELVARRAREAHELTPAESLQIEEWKETALLNQFREDVIWETVQVDEVKLREWYDENVGEEASARHILIGVAPTAPDSVKQAARALADSLLEEARSGADFAALAEAHSGDEGSAQRGGSLGYFARGAMVAPFDSAAFGGAEGEVFPRVVETRFGYHVIKVEERRKRPFDDMREEIEDQLAIPARQTAEEGYVSRMMETSGIEFREPNVDRLNALIDAGEPPSGEERALELASFQGGVIRLGEIWDLFEVLPEGNRRSIAALDQAGMISALAGFVQRRLLLARARAGETEIDSVRQGQLDDLVRQLYAQAYLNDVLRGRLEVADSLVQRYYDEHLEFYRGRSFDEVREEIRTILITQRREAMNDAGAQRELFRAVADSQAAEISVERYPDQYDEVLALLREGLSGSGQTAVAAP
ncbi:MAG TPA: peptidylprolyl isomerase [Gemmatimonadota bacterium]|nr:peptidylprolyl isomerase [Gemmatimonadota bacterium]